MTTYKDTDLREALRRKYTNTPQLPSDFLNRMQQAPRPKKQRASTPLYYGRGSRSIERPFWPSGGWVCIAAVLLIAFLLWPKSHKDTITQPEVQPVVAEASQQTIRPPVIEEKKEEVLAEVQPTKKPVKKRKKTVRKQNTPIEEPVEEIIPAEPVEELTIAMEPTSDSYAAIEAEMIDIRRRGERVEAMVANLTRSF